MKIIVAGMVSDVPGQGGASWAVLQYALGLRRLGHEVVLIEPVRSLERSAQYFRELARTFALDAILLERDSGSRIELTRQQTDGADLLLNLSGVLRNRSLPTSASTSTSTPASPRYGTRRGSTCASTAMTDS